MKKAIFKSAAMGFLAVSTALTAPTAVSAETLKEALAAAYLSNPQLDAQRASLRATDEGVRRAKSNWLPTISGRYRYVDGENKRRSVTDAEGNPVDTDFEPFDTSSYDLNLGQDVFRGFRNFNEVKQAKAQVEAGRAQLTQVEQQVLLDGVTAYMDVVRDEAVARLNKNNVQVLERQLQASRDRFRVGEITRTDVAQSEARLEGAKAQLLSAEANLAGSRATYERVIGRPASSLEGAGEGVELPGDMDQAVVMASQHDPRVLLAIQNEKAADKAVDVAKGALLPTVNVFANYNKTNGTSFAGGISFPSDNDRKLIGVQVSVPIYTGGANHSEVRRTKQLRSQRMLEIRQAEREAQERVLTAWNQHKAAEAQILSRKAAVRANEIALDGVRQEAQVGSRTTLDVLDAEQELLDSRVNLVRAERDETVAAYTLLSSVGQLTARDLGLGIELYDPNANYKKVRNKLAGW